MKKIVHPEPSPESDPDLENLGISWTTVPDIAEACGVSLSHVRGWLKDRLLVAVRRGKNNALHIPADFLLDGEPRGDLHGTFTVLHDGGMTDVEVVRWLFTPDDSFTGGSPMGCLQEGHKAEVRRRAMELSW